MPQGHTKQGHTKQGYTMPLGHTKQGHTMADNAPNSVNLVASTLMKGASTSLARRRAISVLPHPVGPMHRGKLRPVHVLLCRPALASRTNHEYVFWHHFVCCYLWKERAPPTVAEGNRHCPLCIILANL